MDRDVTFLSGSTPQIPAHRRTRMAIYAVALAFHIVLFAVLTHVRYRRVQTAPGDGTATTGIAAYVPGPVGTAGSTPKPPTEAPPKRKVMAARATPAPDRSNDAASGAQGSGAAGQQGAGGGGPVRLGTGGNLTLLKKVTPIYPKVLEAARIPGTVVLDAVIHRDGTIGDVTVLRSSNQQFTQAAIDAVKQWRYTPLPYEGIVTVTVNFSVQS